MDARDGTKSRRYLHFNGFGDGKPQWSAHFIHRTNEIVNFSSVPLWHNYGPILELANGCHSL